MDELKSSGKPFEISKWEVWEAYRQVKANRGAPGVDGVTHRGVREGSEEQSVQDLESDVVGDLFSASGDGGGDTETAWRWDQNPRGADDRGQGRPDGGGPEAGGEGRADLSPGLLRLPAGPVGPGRGGGMPGAVLEERLGDRFGHPEVLRQRRSWDLMVKAVEAHTDVPWVVLYVKRWLTAPLQLPDGTLLAAGSGYPAGVRGLARAGQPVHALCVRRVDGPGVPGRPVRALRRRRGRALRHRTPSQTLLARDREQDGTGRAATAPRQDPDRVLQGRRSGAARLRAHRVHVLGVHFPRPHCSGQERSDSSPRSCPRSATTP